MLKFTYSFHWSLFIITVSKRVLQALIGIIKRQLDQQSLNNICANEKIFKKKKNIYIFMVFKKECFLRKLAHGNRQPYRILEATEGETGSVSQITQIIT